MWCCSFQKARKHVLLFLFYYIQSTRAPNKSQKATLGNGRSEILTIEGIIGREIVMISCHSQRHMTPIIIRLPRGFKVLSLKFFFSSCRDPVSASLHHARFLDPLRVPSHGNLFAKQSKPYINVYICTGIPE